MDYTQLFNQASYTAIKCNKDHVRSNQLSQLLSLVNAPFTKKVDDTIMLLMAFVTRQTTRRLFGKESSDALISTLKVLKDNKDLEDDEKLKLVKEYLGLLKWFFEVADNIRVDWNTPKDKGFDSIINSFQQWASSQSGKRR